MLHTLPEYVRKYTGQLYFRNTQDAASAIFPLKESGARAAEIMDRASLRSVEHLPGSPALLRELPAEAAAILVEYQAQDAEEIQQFQYRSQQLLKGLRLLHQPEFTEDAARQAELWKVRKGIIPSVGAIRPPATTLLCEDVVFPVESLADGVTDLQNLFDKHGYPEGVVFGHAKDGNLHFLVAQSFNTEPEVERFSRFMDDLVEVVSGKYDGALKAEHGTGRNMAPFVETEWGTGAYAIMRDLKSLLDPDNMLNPGVVINPDPRAHVANVKSMAKVAPEVDKCIECGFCEPKCPSRRLTLTPRQRIVVQREIRRLEGLGANGVSASQAALIASLKADFQYSGLDTCAVDGLCAMACPVGINTGDLTKSLRAQAVSARGARLALGLAEHFGLAERAVGMAVRAGHLFDGLPHRNGAKGEPLPASLVKGLEKITGLDLPKWNRHMPRTTSLPRGEPLAGMEGYIYFPSCISRQLGMPPRMGTGCRHLRKRL